MDGFLSTVNDAVSKDLVEKHTFHSSLGSPFLVISKEQLVVSVPEGGDELDVLTHAVEEYVQQLAKKRAVVLADFEGEMPGFGGELVTACFQETLALDKNTLKPLYPAHPSPMMGLFIDLRHSVGINLCAQIMENADITKVIWGAEGDLTSLRFQYLPRKMSIRSRNVVDAQLAFSSPGQRLGMSRMLAKVPCYVLNTLPSKDIIDFDQAHAYNQRALPLPFSHEAALYSVDDLHRLEAVLRTQRPPDCFSIDGGYSQPRDITSALMSEMEKDAYGIQWLKAQQMWMRRMTGNKRGSKAVHIKRHIKQLRIREVALTDLDQQFITTLECDVNRDLSVRNVSIDDVLSWATC